MIERHSIPWYTNHWGTFWEDHKQLQLLHIGSSFKHKKHQRETFGEIRSQTSYHQSTFAWSPQSSRTIAPSLVSTNFYSENLTSNHKSSWLRDSSRFCVDQITYSRRHTINGDFARFERCQKYHYFLFISWHKHIKIGNAREQDAKFSTHYKQTSSSVLSALIGDFLLSRALRSDTIKKISHRCAQKPSYHFILEPFCPAEISELHDTKPWTLIGHRKAIHTQTTHRLSRPHGGGHQPHPTTDPPGRRLQTWSNFK